jgi:flagellar biogenesis protein FliO
LSESWTQECTVLIPCCPRSGGLGRFAMNAIHRLGSSSMLVLIQAMRELLVLGLTEKQRTTDATVTCNEAWQSVPTVSLEAGKRL